MAAPVFSSGPGKRIRAGKIGFDLVYSIDLKPVKQRIEEAVERVVETSAQAVLDEAQRMAPVRRVVKGQRAGKVRRLSVAERKSEQKTRSKLGIGVGKALINTQAESRRNRAVPSNPYLRSPGKRPPRAGEGGLEAVKLTRGSSGAFSVKSGHQLSSRGAYALRTSAAISGPTVYRKGQNEKTRAQVAQNRALLKKTNSAAFFKKSGASTITGGLRGGGQYQLGGRLKGEIYSEDASSKEGVYRWEVVSPTHYARYVEFGTRRSRAQPYLRPALASTRRKFADTLRSNLKKLNWKPKRKHVRTSL